jgi:hypothetical protein
MGAAVLRQAFVGLSDSMGRLRFRAGRFEFADGSEAAPTDPDLAALKRDRINQRLIASFNYALRSFDGAQFGYQRGASNFTALAVRAVEGSFQLRAFNEIDVDLAYAAYTRSLASAKTPSEFRVFTLWYRDGRPLKVDNRPAEMIEADRGPIRLATHGAHFITRIKSSAGAADIVLWGAAQLGRWGALDHRGFEFAGEAGYQLAAKTRPWVRAGYLRSSGDGNPTDGLHHTFFRVLSTPRAYARFPFYILMNVDDRFFQFRTTPARRLTLRTELHWVRLAAARDLWYDGGGAFQTETFGYLARPSGGSRRLGSAFDASADYSLSPRTTLSAYAGAAWGSVVTAFVFPAGGRRPAAQLLSIEVVRLF